MPKTNKALGGEREETFMFYLSYGHDVDSPTLIEVMAKDSQQGYFRAVERYKSIFDTLNKEFTLKEIFDKKGIGEYAPYYFEKN